MPPHITFKTSDCHFCSAIISVFSAKGDGYALDDGNCSSPALFAQKTYRWKESHPRRHRDTILQN